MVEYNQEKLKEISKVKRAAGIQNNERDFNNRRHMDDESSHSSLFSTAATYLHDMKI